MTKKLIFGFLLLFLAWHLALPIYLNQADLGRHIKNGELLLKGVADVLYTNYYSYTATDYSFVNHHWFFGVITYLVWKWLDFGGLSIFYIILQMIIFSLFVSRVRKTISFTLLCVFCLLSFPMIASRPEIRPEGISMLLCGLFWVLGDWYNQGRIKATHFKIHVFFLQIIWVNSHSYFPLGLVMVFTFWMQAKINHREQAKVFLESYFFLVVACFINPSGLSGALFPFTNRESLGYSIIEGQSVFFMMRGAPIYSIYHYFLISFGVAVLGWLLVIKHQGFKKHIFMLFMFCLMSFAAFKEVRFISPYAFFWVPMTAYCWGNILEAWPLVFRKIVLSILLIAGILASFFMNFNVTRPPVFGLVKHSNDAADFFKTQGLRGPIFNNYDIGGYLIFYLSPKEKLFVDNRVEAFPGAFFRKIYIPMQVNNEIWKIVDAQYHFNVIFFTRADQTPWSYKFITRRFEDPDWAVVFIDDDAVILIRRNVQNADIIKRHEIKMLKTIKHSKESSSS